MKGKAGWLSLVALGAAGLLAPGAPIAAPGGARAQASGPALAHLPWPVAAPNPALDPAQALTFIAFGSCHGQEQSQAFWHAIAATSPQAFVFLGDNVYGDTGWDGGPDLASFLAAYRKLAASAPFNALRRSVPMLEVWDDHDFGPNDSGASFAYRAQSREIFQTFWNVPAEASGGRGGGRDGGVYRSLVAGPKGQRVQFLLLDTRYFRSDLVELPEDRRRGLGRWGLNTEPGATILGEEQWQWLAGELAKPADLRVLVSSIQVLTLAHDFESWSRFPKERERLLAMVEARAGGGLILLSGDRHAAGFYEAKAPGGEILREFTSSSLNRPLGIDNARADEREPDPLRVGGLAAQSNFGTMGIDWQARRLALRIRDETGAVVRGWDPGF